MKVVGPAAEELGFFQQIMAHGKLPEREQFLFGTESRSSHFLRCGYSFRSPLKAASHPRGVGFEGAGKDPDVQRQEFVIFYGCGVVRVTEGDSPSAAEVRVIKEWPCPCWNIPTGMPGGCGKQLFPHRWQEIPAEFPVIFPALVQFRMSGVGLTCGFKLAKTGRRCLTLGWLILKALA